MSTEIAPPKSTGAPPREICLTGTFIPGTEDGPLFMRIVASPYCYLVCFSELDQLVRVMEQTKQPFTTVKQINDGAAFLGTFPRAMDGKEIKVILDPYFTEEGHLRYIEVKWN